MYFLAKDCYVCNTQGYWLILNVSRDKYLCVTHADLTSIGSGLYGWRYGSGDAGNGRHLDAGRETLIESLVAKGVLTSNPEEGKAFAESENAATQTAIVLPVSIGSAKLHLFCVVRFFFACAKIDRCLRAGKLARALVTIKQRRLQAGSCARFLEDSSATKLIASFNNLRPLYPRPYLCLFDSLALLEFLSGYHSYPRIVFGVVADPFQAHCWLQDGSVLLNDDLERVGRYKPILSV
jgi:hypothetical protein